ncbi:uncharacterized protein PAE49_009854 [Odontesthes bonariensis]|uniref:uncharacterized protein LOC142388230 n=1 Tax=Odontesthes bonariensis TaxID=219752 RepID=UPI003F58AD19
MHQHTRQHVFTPILHQPAAIPPVMMGTQDRNLNMHPPRQTPRAYFSPINAIHRATQKSFRSITQGRWGAMHVCIAWRIYYHQQLEKMKQNPKSLQQELLPECSTTSLPDSVQPKESHQPCCSSLDSPCEVSPFRNTGDRSESGNMPANMSENRSCPSDHQPSSSASCDSHAAPLGDVDRPAKRLLKKKVDGKERDISNQTDVTKDLPFRDKSWHPQVIPELDGGRIGSLGRKRKLEDDGFLQVKRVKQETEDNQSDSSLTLHSDPSSLIAPHAHPSSHTVQAHDKNISSLCVSNPNGCTCTISHPGTELHPYQTLSRDPTWSSGLDFHFRQKALKGYFCNSFYGFFAPPLYFPLALRQQETVRHRRTQTLPFFLPPLQMSTPSSWPLSNILSGPLESPESA